jgi:hypothetical protein
VLFVLLFFEKWKKIRVTSKFGVLFIVEISVCTYIPTYESLRNNSHNGGTPLLNRRSGIPASYDYKKNHSLRCFSEKDKPTEADFDILLAFVFNIWPGNHAMYDRSRSRPANCNCLVDASVDDMQTKDVAHLYATVPINEAIRAATWHGWMDP